MTVFRALFFGKQLHITVIIGILQFMSHFLQKIYENISERDFVRYFIILMLRYLYVLFCRQ